MKDMAYSTVDTTAAIAVVLAHSMEHRSVRWPYVNDISDLFFSLREMGFRFRDLGLRRIPDGYYSEDVENFVGQLLSMGYATQRSPIRLDEGGVRVCKEILANEYQRNKSEVERLEIAVHELVCRRTSPLEHSVGCSQDGTGAG